MSTAEEVPSLLDLSRRQVLGGSALAVAGLGLPLSALAETFPSTRSTAARGTRKET